MILGIVGMIGSGKDTVANYISHKYGYEIVSFRDIVHDIVKERGLESTRENMQKTARECRDKYGEYYFSKKALEKGIALLKKGKKVLFKEMRTEGDVEILRKEFDRKIKIIIVEAGERTRFERVKKRGRLGDPKTLDEFMIQQKKEEELHFTDSLKLADLGIDNNGTKKELESEIDKMMEDLKRESY